jgi:hypothetical protein
VVVAAFDKWISRSGWLAVFLLVVWGGTGKSAVPIFSSRLRGRLKVAGGRSLGLFLKRDMRGIKGDITTIYKDSKGGIPDDYA